MSDIEILRSAAILVPDPGDPAETILVAPSRAGGEPRLFCSCQRGKKYAECRHSRLLLDRFTVLAGRCGGDPAAAFSKSIWYRLFLPAIRHGGQSCNAALAREHPAGYTVDADGTAVVTVKGRDEQALTLMGRLACPVRGAANRFALMSRCRDFCLSETEKVLAERGLRSQQQSREDTLWFRLASHLWHEHGDCADRLAARIDETEALLVIEIGDAVRVSIPAPVVAETASLLASDLPAACAFTMAPGLHRLVFQIRTVPGSGLAYKLQPFIVNGTPGAPLPLVPRLLFADRAFVPQTGAFHHLDHASLRCCALRLHELPPAGAAETAATLERHGDMLFKNEAAQPAGQTSLFDVAAEESCDRIDFPAVIRRFDALCLDPVSLGDAECELGIRCVSAGVSVPYEELLRAHREDRRFAVTADAVVDMHAPAVAGLPWTGADPASGTIKLPRAALTQFSGVTAIRLDRKNRFSAELALLLEVKPGKPLRPLRGLTAKLRPYQKRGVEWLLYLYDNRFGGLLCDEMGLGKTIQALGLIFAVRQQRKLIAPILVVCPATVMDHWKQLAGRFAPSLPVTVHHGPDRDLDAAQAQAGLVVTSYGVLKNDLPALDRIRPGIVVFDEIQNLKNRATGAWEAAAVLQAPVKIGLSGTPIENALSDLKSLFDVVLPGYLGADIEFFDRFAGPIEQRGDAIVADRLKRMVRPFILRRLKADVLTDLPPKTEEVRAIGLSPAQQELYRQVAVARARPLAGILRDTTQSVPYLHVFRAIDEFKRICCHPALFHRCPDRYEQYESEKFMLFQELVDEALESGEKIAVFSNYLDMIEIIGRWLDSRGAGRAVLTGESRDRGAIVRRFNTDASCRVFIGSLRAGGLGIDLTAASVVIHYDRWWNAAREDQATDRVHRMGQNRGVQVFKFVTRNTVEQHIDGIIARKRDLALKSLATDTPDEVKRFTREELLEMLEG